MNVPLLCTRLTPNTAWDWNFTTTAQPGLNGRVVPFPRGIGLGGSSAVSAYQGALVFLVNTYSVSDCHVYTRGSSEDINQWAALTEDESWGWDAMLPYFKKVCLQCCFEYEALLNKQFRARISRYQQMGTMSPLSTMPPCTVTRDTSEPVYQEPHGHWMTV